MNDHFALWGAWAAGATQWLPARELGWTFAILAFAWILNALHARGALSWRELGHEQARQRHVNFRNGLLVATLAVLGFVWGGEIRALILSLAAIGAAVMIVSKEIISCLYGAIIFSFSKLARIGDSIEVGPWRGELIDHNWLSLTLMDFSETHYYSGKIIKVPTSMLLVHPLANLSQGGAYRFASLLLHARVEHASSALALAEAAAREVCAPWLEVAKSSVSELMVAGLGVSPNVDPQAALVSVDKDAVAVSLRVVVPAGERASAQAEISKRFFAAFEQHLSERKRSDRAAEAAACAQLAAAERSAA